MEQPKYCKDCKWCYRELIFRLVHDWSCAECRKPVPPTVDLKRLVHPGNGTKEYCESSRKHGPCGMYAKFWEPKHGEGERGGLLRWLMQKLNKN